MHDRRLAARAGELKPSAVRELLKHSKLPGVISLGGGIPAPELFDTEGLELAVQKVMSERFNDAFQYGLTEGYPPLRQAVSEIWAICILGLEFIHSNPRLLVGQKAASGWIFLFFTTLRESNIGWILRRALSRVNPTLHLLPASTMSECAAHTRPCLVLLEYHCQPCGLLWSTTSLHG